MDKISPNWSANYLFFSAFARKLELDMMQEGFEEKPLRRYYFVSIVFTRVSPVDLITNWPGSRIFLQNKHINTYSRLSITRAHTGNWNPFELSRVGIIESNYRGKTILHKADVIAAKKKTEASTRPIIIRRNQIIVHIRRSWFHVPLYSKRLRRRAFLSKNATIFIKSILLLRAFD